MGLSSVILSAATRAHLASYRWPGNVRELEHAIHRAVVLARAASDGADVTLKPQHFAIHGEPVSVIQPREMQTEAVNLREATDAFQRQAIMQTLESQQNNWAATARALSLDVANLHRLAKRLGLKD